MNADMIGFIREIRKISVLKIENWNYTECKGASVIPREKILPTVLIIINVLAACCYIPTGEWRRVVYWMAAGILTYTVTW